MDIFDYYGNKISLNNLSASTIPTILFDGELPPDKAAGEKTFKCVCKEFDFDGYATLKVQGNSSTAYPKKNYTVKFYKDSSVSSSAKIDIGFGNQSKYVLKANWIDISHSRNIVSARIWANVVKTRNDIPDLLLKSPNLGAVNGIPVKVYFNGDYWGRYTINIPKDAWMFSMDKNNEKHVILCGESNTADECMFRGYLHPIANEITWSDELRSTPLPSLNSAWGNAIKHVAESSDAEFKANIGTYFDVTSLIDYYIFNLSNNGIDAFGKNQLFISYDGKKFYASAYDMDSTWGLYWNGGHFMPSDNAYPDGYCATTNYLYERLNANFSQEIKSRYEDLRRGPLSESSILAEFEKFCSVCPPYVVSEDYADTTGEGNFTGIPLKDENNIKQIRAYVKDRLLWLDGIME